MEVLSLLEDVFGATVNLALMASNKSMFNFWASSLTLAV